MTNNKGRGNDEGGGMPDFDVEKSVEEAVERLARAAREGAMQQFLKPAWVEGQWAEAPEAHAAAPEPRHEALEPEVQVYSVADVEARRAAARTRDDGDSVDRVCATLSLMIKRGGWRKLRPLDVDWRRQFDALEQSFPNCSPLFDYLRGQAALAARSDRALPGIALLLDGPPGIGKSVIAEAVAEVIGGGFKRVPLAAAQSGGQLSGSDDFWSNAKYGDIFDALVNGEYANPVIQLDEIDKVNADMRYDPLGALYDLLEPAAARRYCDRTFPSIPLDASRILWIATSNNRRFIPTPILDRLTLIEIREPTRAESLQVVTSVDRRLHEDHPAIAGMRVSDAVLHALAGVPPRRMRKSLQEADGKAAYAGRHVVELADLPSLDNAIRSIGFL